MTTAGRFEHNRWRARWRWQGHWRRRGWCAECGAALEGRQLHLCYDCHEAERRAGRCEIVGYPDAMRDRRILRRLAAERAKTIEALRIRCCTMAAAATMFRLSARLRLDEAYKAVVVNTGRALFDRAVGRGPEPEPEPDDEENEDNESCPDCGGVGGGPDQALTCPYCRGSGLRHPRPRWQPDLDDPAVRDAP